MSRHPVVRVAALGLAVCGCNAVFGLEETKPIEAAYFDAPPEETLTCPAGGEEPMFDGVFQQIDAKGCVAYVPSKSWGHAVAWCSDAVGMPGTIRQGIVDSSLASSTLTPPPTSPFAPRLSDDGELLLVRTSPTTAYELFRRAGDDTWTHVITMDFGVGVSGASQPTDPLPLRHMFILKGYDLVELEQRDGIPWAEVRRQTLTSMGAARIERMSVSRDGKRLVAEGNLSGDPNVVILYATRSDLTMPFGTMRTLTTVPPQIQWAYMTDNCSRVYFSDAGTVFYLRRL